MVGTDTHIEPLSETQFWLMEESRIALQTFLQDKERISGIQSALEKITEDKDLQQLLVREKAEVAEIAGTALWLTGNGLMYDIGAKNVRVLTPVERQQGVFVYNQLIPQNPMYANVIPHLYAANKDITGDAITKDIDRAKQALYDLTY